MAADRLSGSPPDEHRLVRLNQFDVCIAGVCTVLLVSPLVSQPLFQNFFISHRRIL